MMRAVVFSLISAAVAGLGMVAIESCGAMAFELPPEEPLPEASGPPRLMRHEAGAPNPGANAPP